MEVLVMVWIALMCYGFLTGGIGIDMDRGPRQKPWEDSTWFDYEEGDKHETHRRDW